MDHRTVVKLPVFPIYRRASIHISSYWKCQFTRAAVGRCSSTVPHEFRGSGWEDSGELGVRVETTVDSRQSEG